MHTLALSAAPFARCRPPTFCKDNGPVCYVPTSMSLLSRS